MLINYVKYETENKKYLVNDMEAIQNNNIMSITQASQTQNNGCIRIYDCQYFVYMCEHISYVKSKISMGIEIIRYKI